MLPGPAKAWDDAHAVASERDGIDGHGVAATDGMAYLSPLTLGVLPHGAGR